MNSWVQIIEWFYDCGICDVSGDEILLQKNDKKTVTSLTALRKIIENIEISIKDCAMNMVFGTGNENADVLILGEAPGAEEDRQGLPFVGQSGQLLDKMMSAIGLDRSKVYITNILPWRPPGNRTPSNEEILTFLPYVLNHISIIDPKIVVCLGGTATKALLQTNKSMNQLRGKWTKVDGISAEILATFHPAYLLRSPSQKRECWIDFLLIKSKLSSLGCL